MSDAAWFDLGREASIIDQQNRAWTAFAVVIFALVAFFGIFAIRVPGLSTTQDAVVGLVGLVLAGAAAYAAARYVQSRTIVAQRIGVSDTAILVETTRGGRLRWDWSDPALSLEIHDAAYSDRGTRRFVDLERHEFRLVVRPGDKHLMFPINWPAAAAILRSARAQQLPISKDQYRGSETPFIANRVARTIPSAERIAPEDLARLLKRGDGVLAGG